ncbi:hypothetical protein VTN00DRAFT_2140 [Thermoascus crustaceus]|uniref:uncharacterized protein n=1 Tax=Thermoascus crustaceus TaxID=5088 RepID=UPI003744A73E
MEASDEAAAVSGASISPASMRRITSTALDGARVNREEGHARAPLREKRRSKEDDITRHDAPPTAIGRPAGEALAVAPQPLHLFGPFIDLSDIHPWARVFDALLLLLQSPVELMEDPTAHSGTLSIGPLGNGLTLPSSISMGTLHVGFRGHLPRLGLLVGQLGTQGPRFLSGS